MYNVTSEQSLKTAQRDTLENTIDKLKNGILIYVQVTQEGWKIEQRNEKQREQTENTMAKWKH